MSKVCFVSFCKSFKCSSAVSFWPFLYLKQRVILQVRVLSLHATQNFANSDNLCNTAVTARDRELLSSHVSVLNLVCQYAWTIKQCKLLDNTFLTVENLVLEMVSPDKWQVSHCSVWEVTWGLGPSVLHWNLIFVNEVLSQPTSNSCVGSKESANKLSKLVLTAKNLPPSQPT